MSTDEEESKIEQSDAQEPDASQGGSPVVGGEGEGDLVAGHIGVEKYVHTAFFITGILAAFLCGKMLLSLWNNLAEWPVAVRALPHLIRYTEEERGSITLIMGAVLGVFLILRYYRRPAVRSWATAVAGELARVTWPSKDTVTSGTVVVLVAGAIATVYVALLDRLWGYLTNLVYGA
jgi:preprotein translocase subunit SecE